MGDNVDGPTDGVSMDCKVGLDVGRPSFIDTVGLYDVIVDRKVGLDVGRAKLAVGLTVSCCWRVGCIVTGRTVVCSDIVGRIVGPVNVGRFVGPATVGWTVDPPPAAVVGLISHVTVGRRVTKSSIGTAGKLFDPVGSAVIG